MKNNPIKLRSPLEVTTTRDINRAVKESQWFAALVGHSDVSAEAKELIRCVLIAHCNACNAISRQLSDRTNPPPDLEMVQDIYPWGRMAYPDENGLDALTILLTRMEELGITGVPPYIKRYALTKARRARVRKLR